MSGRSMARVTQVLLVRLRLIYICLFGKVPDDRNLDQDLIGSNVDLPEQPTFLVMTFMNGGTLGGYIARVQVGKESRLRFVSNWMGGNHVGA
jgi:hypothetical protein